MIRRLTLINLFYIIITSSFVHQNLANEKNKNDVIMNSNHPDLKWLHKFRKTNIGDDEFSLSSPENSILDKFMSWFTSNHNSEQSTLNPLEEHSENDILDNNISGLSDIYRKSNSLRKQNVNINTNTISGDKQSLDVLNNEKTLSAIKNWIASRPSLLPYPYNLQDRPPYNLQDKPPYNLQDRPWLGRRNNHDEPRLKMNDRRSTREEDEEEAYEEKNFLIRIFLKIRNKLKNFFRELKKKYEKPKSKQDNEWFSFFNVGARKSLNSKEHDDNPLSSEELKKMYENKNIKWLKPQLVHDKHLTLDSQIPDYAIEDLSRSFTTIVKDFLHKYCSTSKAEKVFIQKGIIDKNNQKTIYNKKIGREDKPYYPERFPKRKYVYNNGKRVPLLTRRDYLRLNYDNNKEPYYSAPITNANRELYNPGYKRTDDVGYYPGYKRTDAVEYYPGYNKNIAPYYPKSYKNNIKHFPYYPGNNHHQQKNILYYPVEPTGIRRNFPKLQSCNNPSHLRPALESTIDDDDEDENFGLDEVDDENVFFLPKLKHTKSNKNNRKHKKEYDLDLPREQVPLPNYFLEDYEREINEQEADEDEDMNEVEETQKHFIARHTPSKLDKTRKSDNKAVPVVKVGNIELFLHRQHEPGTDEARKNVDEISDVNLHYLTGIIFLHTHPNASTGDLTSHIFNKELSELTPVEREITEKLTGLAKNSLLEPEYEKISQEADKPEMENFYKQYKTGIKYLQENPEATEQDLLQNVMNKPRQDLSDEELKLLMLLSTLSKQKHLLEDEYKNMMNNDGNLQKYKTALAISSHLKI